MLFYGQGLKGKIRRKVFSVQGIIHELFEKDIRKRKTGYTYVPVHTTEKEVQEEPIVAPVIRWRMSDLSKLIGGNMKTLIELFDDRPMENVLATEVFQPEETFLLCPPEAVSGRRIRETIEQYLAYRHCPTKISIVSVSLLDSMKVEKQIRKILESHPDCAIDICGGTESALFAAGKVCGNTPVFTFSRKRNTFYEVSNAPFARNLPCELKLNAEACFMLAGGKLLPGREDNAGLRNRLPQIDRLFSVFRKHRRIWRNQITYIQKISSSEPGLPATR